MKIIHVITAFGIGGAEKLLVNIINRQIENHSVNLIYLKEKNDLIADLDSRVIIKQIRISKNVVSELKEYYDEVNPDVIHTHLGHADLIGIWSARKLKAKIFCTMHNVSFKKNILDFFFFKVYTFLFLKVVKKAKVISISKVVEHHVINKLKIPKNRSYLLMNAIPSKKINSFDKSKKSIDLLFVGRLEKQKSIETLLKAMCILNKRNLDKKIHLNIIGDGSLKLKLESLTKELKIESLVSFKGEEKDVDFYYSNSDIFILPSIWEGFGIVILEAFRAQVAVIASNIEGPAELISNNVNGLLFNSKDYKGLADKVLDLVENDKKRKEIGLKGFETFSEEYQIDNYVKKLDKIYKND